MSTYVIKNSNDARNLALLFDVELPEGRGRFPIARLRTAVQAMGHHIDDSGYDSTSATTETCYEVSGFARTDKRKNDVRIAVSAIICASDIRKFAPAKRGRLSHSATADAAAAMNEWLEFEMTDIRELGVLHVD